MFKNFIILFLAIGLVTISACRDDFDYDVANGNISFSRDTVSLDTVFNHRQSDVNWFSIHNHSDKDVQISHLYLTKGAASFYKINVDGTPGYDFENVAIRKKDSIIVYVKVDAEDAPTVPLYEDEINVELGSEIQQVKLRSWIEKADFFTTPEGQDYLDLNNVSWSNNSSKVIEGNLRVSGSFDVQAGTKIYIHSGSGLTINNNTTVNVNGSLGNEVVFRTERHNTRYDSMSNQWDKIDVLPNVSGTINYAKIIGANIGLKIQESTLTLSNTIIANNYAYGIYAIQSNLTGSNLIIANNNLANMAVDLGGSYNFRQCTFANFFTGNSAGGPNYSLYLSNKSDDETSTNPLTNANFGNCLFWGYNSNAIIFDASTNAAFNYQFTNCLIRNENLSAMNVLTDNYFTNCIKDNPMFVFASFTGFNLKLKENSPAKNTGSTSALAYVSTDILGLSRGASPSIGAYQ